MSNKIVVGWVSRHDPLKGQIELLKAKLVSDIEIVKLSKTYKNANIISEMLNNIEAKYAVVVLPLSMIQHLIHTPELKGVKILKAEMKPATGDYNPDWDVLMEDEPGMKRHKTFTGYKVYRDIIEITEPFEANQS